MNVYWRRLPAWALMTAAVVIGCQGAPSGPQALTEEERLERQLEQAGLTECLAEFQRVRASLAGLPRDQVLLELRRIVRLCFSPSGLTTILDVAARTTGLDRDADGYTVQVAGQPDRALSINGSERFEGLPPGDVQVALTGIAANCIFLGDNPRTVSVTPGVAVGTTFELECFSSESAGAIVGFGDQIDALFLDPVIRQAARGALEQIAIDVDTGDDAAARAGALQFIDFLTDRHALGELTDPNDGAPPTTEEAVVDLAVDVAEFAELGTPPLTEAALSDDGAVELVGAGGGLVVTGNGHSGVSFPLGALPGPTLIIISRLPEEGAPADHDGPLPTALDQYPLFYDISTFPEVGELGEDAVVGICVVDPPDPFAPDPAIVGRLRLAHPSPADPTTIEILPLADASFLDCAGATSGPAESAAVNASRNLRLAGPGKLGGAISSFSPFGAVDPGGPSTGPGPAIRIDSPASGTETSASTTAVTGQVTGQVSQATISVTESGAAAPSFTNQLQLDSNGAFSTQVPLFGGSNTITVAAADPAQNQGTTSIVVTRTGGSDALTATLTWDSTADMDLHLLRGETTAFFDQTNDCFFSNCQSTNPAGRPDWGPSGEVGNPRLDLDDRNGFGPENTRLDVVESGVLYRVGVHAFSGSGNVTATINFGNQTIRCGPVFLSGGQTAVLAVFSEGQGATCSPGTGSGGAARGVRLQEAMKAPALTPPAKAGESP